MAQLINDDRNGLHSARDDAQTSSEVSVQATYLYDDGKQLPASHVIGFSQHNLLVHCLLKADSLSINRNNIRGFKFEPRCVLLTAEKCLVSNVELSI